MLRKLRYPEFADVTSCSIVFTGGPSQFGDDSVLSTCEGKVNWSEKAQKVQDKDGNWIKLSGVIHVGKDLLDGIADDVTGGRVTIAGLINREINAINRPRNPDGTVNHTRIEVI
ncbi:MAG: hypothetical protein J6Z43_03965 [Clostridiales bacterium]|nr:hypothetical protein [Clostridiales bacterium]